VDKERGTRKQAKKSRAVVEKQRIMYILMYWCLFWPFALKNRPFINKKYNKKRPQLAIQHVFFPAMSSEPPRRLAASPSSAASASHVL